MNFEEMKQKYNYYENKHGILFNCDCMHLMEIIPDEYFELAIVDIPYNINKDALHQNRFTKGSGKLKDRAIQRFNGKFDNFPVNDNYFQELYRVSENQIIWGGNYYKLGRTRGFIIWDKEQPFENFSACEFAWTSFDSPSKIYKQATTRTNEIKIHICQKPVALYRWLLQNYAKKDDKIFDSHVGSASSFIACMELGFNFTGCELDVDYFNESVERIKLEEARIENKFYLSDNSLFDFEKDNT
jgi:site-specific DNA-methyltransferase (adenine-specific)